MENEQDGKTLEEKTMYNSEEVAKILKIYVDIDHEMGDTDFGLINPTSSYSENEIKSFFEIGLKKYNKLLENYKKGIPEKIRKEVSKWEWEDPGVEEILNERIEDYEGDYKRRLEEKLREKGQKQKG